MGFLKQTHSIEFEEPLLLWEWLWYLLLLPFAVREGIMYLAVAIFLIIYLRYNNAFQVFQTRKL